MLCEECKKREATTYLKTVINGKVKEQHLCGHCAKEKGITASFNLSNPLSDMLTSILGDTAAIGAAVADKRCGCCNSTLADIMNSGKLGCSECYNSFYEELLPYFKRIHGGVKHIGKIAYTSDIGGDKTFEETESEETVETLKSELKRLVKEENYEQAAVVRDKIKAMEENNG